MLTYGVYRNGQLLTRAGLRKGVLSAIVTWVSREGKKSPDELPEGSVVPGLECRVGGLNTARPAAEEHVDWLVLQELRLGDEVSVRIGRGSGARKPISRRQASSSTRTRRGKKLLRCSFCLVERPVRRESGGPGVALGANGAICFQCLAVALAMAESQADRALHLSRQERRACSFCGREKPATLFGTKAHRICTHCMRGIAAGF